MVLIDLYTPYAGYATSPNMPVMNISNLLDDIVFGKKHTSCWGGYEAECAGRYALHEPSKAFVFGASYWVHGEVCESVHKAHAKFLFRLLVFLDDRASFGRSSPCRQLYLRFSSRSLAQIVLSCHQAKQVYRPDRRQVPSGSPLATLSLPLLLFQPPSETS